MATLLPTLLVLILVPGIIAPASAQVREPAPLTSQALAQIKAIVSEKVNRTAAQRKVDSQLLQASRMAQGQAVADGVPVLQTGVVESGGRTKVEIRANVSASLLDRLRSIGVEIVSSEAAYDDVTALVPLTAVEAIAAMPDVRGVHVAPLAITHGVPRRRAQTGRDRAARQQQRRLLAERVRRALDASGQVDDGPVTQVGNRVSQGDRAHLASSARGRYGIDGSGVKIGVLSDSVDGLAQAQASGDLGPVTVLAGQGGLGSGEGTAMLEMKRCSP